MSTLSASSWKPPILCSFPASASAHRSRLTPSRQTHKAARGPPTSLHVGHATLAAVLRFRDNVLGSDGSGCNSIAPRNGGVMARRIIKPPLTVLHPRRNGAYASCFDYDRGWWRPFRCAAEKINGGDVRERQPPARHAEYRPCGSVAIRIVAIPSSKF